jgi:hypothetical protein
MLLGVTVTGALACRRRSTPETSRPEAPLVSPPELFARLDEVRAGRIAVLHVGPRYLWDKGHVPGSRPLGEAGHEDGLQALRAAILALPVGSEIVAYCGCCPTTHCPNIGPAREVLGERSGARFLDLPTNLRTDWIQRGYPVEKA